MNQFDRRQFFASAAASSAVGLTSLRSDARPLGHAGPDSSVEVLLPRDRVPLSFIIDDSTCLVNMGHFCTPQFHACYPNRKEYLKDWAAWPREIPDEFVREFGEWCAEHGVKGKYSIVPNPACVGWLDRELPGWSRKNLLSSLKLVRDLMLPNWDIHPEMITHTRVIDLKTGRPMEEISPATMENSYPRQKKSVDYLASYLAYALRILKNCELPCEGVTTPGGFGNMVKSELSLAVQQAVRDVYAVEIPHYFKYVITGDASTEPKLEHVANADSMNPQLTVNVPCGTGDWFGGWQGDKLSEGNRYANKEATQGRMVELIEKRQPAIMLCHWPGMYSNGSKEGFNSFKAVVEAIDSRFREQTIWMKVSEIARYWAAKELTRIASSEDRVTLMAPFAEPQFTIRIPGRQGPPKVASNGKPISLRNVKDAKSLESGCWRRESNSLVICFSLPKGKTTIQS